ncbi:MAG: HEAT repeat domain-containing protein, partial [Treponema sp.]|nr:HEAT repeat domain-containing protein [Treponema sp.]
MLKVKRCILALAVLLAPVLPVMGQTGNTSEMTVEESYLQESVEMMIIREQTRAESREMKMIALEYIGDAIKRGNTGDEVRQALEFLGLEGVLNRARENGRLVNNYPDIRREAAKYLGQMKTPEARDTLLKMVYADNEPMVLQEVVKSLADIGDDDNGRTTSVIARVVEKFDILAPDNLLALSALEAFEKLGASGGGIKDPNIISMLIRIAEGNYIRPVQDRAKQILLNIRKSQSEEKKQ